MESMETRSMWHAGEVALQERTGVAAQMAYLGPQAIVDHMVLPHRRFLTTLPYIVAGTTTEDGFAWATVLEGADGFLKSPSPRCVRVAAYRVDADPIWMGVVEGGAIGFLGIDLQHRRRIRVNGHVTQCGPDAFEVEVGQSYGNCPQYIQKREAYVQPDSGTRQYSEVYWMNALDEVASGMIRSADTLFIVSYADVDGERQVDVSHRGGNPGFVRVGADGSLTVPDFAGNRYFNTLGNIFVNPRCGLTFVGFDSGDVLQLTGDAELILDLPEVTAFQGAERLLRFVPRQIVLRRRATRLRWQMLAGGASPSTANTGDWNQAESRIRAREAGAAWRPFLITKVVEESAVIRSLYLQAGDGLGIWPPVAGQHVKLRTRLPGEETPRVGCYSFSSAAADPYYRISILRGAGLPDHLHTLGVGDVVELGEQGGEFTLDASCPKVAVLVAAGIGIAPMLGMLRQIMYEQRRARLSRPVWLVYAARSVERRAFDEELQQLASASGEVIQITRILSNVSKAASHDFELSGHIDLDIFRRTLSLGEAPFDGNAEFFICTPNDLMQKLYDGLRGFGVPDGYIRTESFGSHAVARYSDGNEDL